MEDIKIIVKDDDFIYDTIDVDENGENITHEEIIEVVEVDQIESIDVDSEQAFAALGESNESLNHALMHNRDIADQHPIAAITGLRGELDEIERLKRVYSDEKQVADYYEWEDGNPLGENRVGYFVSICSDVRMIKICTGEDAFGVIVDSAAFIGGQDDIKRDFTYGLVVYSGMAHVRCELDIVVGDAVISNDYGMAKKANGNYGYKVVALHEINDILYATVSLDIPVDQMDSIGKEMDVLGDRISDAETNIVAAINVANAAYNKAQETGDISEEAIKNALEALEKADGAVATTDKMSELVSSANEAAVQAKAIAESAAVSAEAIRNEAVKTSNEALAGVNDLIEDLEPIMTWSDPESGNTGAEYLTTYIKDGLATKVEVQTVETKTDDNKSAIEHNAESFRTLVASVDKYSVGEYSQSYGLTHEQAVSILKDGMIYVPTRHEDAQSHSETFEDTKEENWFTPGSYYIWTINDQGIYDWVETKDSVAFFSETPVPSSALRYWYIDSDTAPDGYEPRALYIYEDGKWVKVNIFYNNPGNRMVSSISQEVDNISLEITNARGGYTGLDARLTDTDAQLELATFWNQPDSGKSNLAAVKLDSSDNNSNLALVVMSKDGEQELSGASIVLGQNGEKSYISLDSDNINLEGYTTINNSFTIDENGYMRTTGGTIGGWDIQSTLLEKRFYDSTNNITHHIFIQADGSSPLNSAFAVRQASGDYTNTDPSKWDYKFIVTNNGKLTATDGSIGSWYISDSSLKSKTGYIISGDYDGGNTIRISSGHIDFWYGGKYSGRIGQTADNNITIESTNLVLLGVYSRFCLNDKLAVYQYTDKDIGIGPVNDGWGTSINSGLGGRIDFRVTQNGSLKLFGRFNEYGLHLPDHSGILLNDKYAFRRYQSAVWVGVDTEPLKLVGSTITANGTGITSDERKKNTIVGLDNKYTQLFDTLSAKTYKFNEYRQDVTNCGFIAQELLESMSNVGLTTKDFGAFVDVYGDGREYAIDYTQFIPIMWEEIKSLRNRISELENKE